MSTPAWITGASSGIGAACALAAPAGTDVVGVCRGTPAGGRHLQADLTRPDDWAAVLRDVERTLPTARQAYLLHLAGDAEPVAPAVAADSDDYVRAFQLNAGAGIAIGQGFLQLCDRYGVPATLVLCSSPSASDVLPGMSQYGAARAAIEQWTRIVAVEQVCDGLRVVAVVPYAVDTPMLRGVMDAGADEDPLARHFRELDARGELASPEVTAGQIWELALDPGDAGPIVAVGARHLATR